MPNKTLKKLVKSVKSTFKRATTRSKAAKKPRLSLKDPAADRESSTYENPIASRELILRIVNHHGTLTEEEVIDVLQLRTEDEVVGLSRRMRAMVRDGQLHRNRSGNYVAVNDEDLIRGKIIAHPEGFGFLAPEDGGADLFLHARQMRPVLHGDKVVAHVTGVDGRGRKEAAIVRVIEHANTHIVGRLKFEDGMVFLSPDNKRIHQDIMVKEDQLGDAKEGQMVVVEITKQPTFRHQPIGRVDKVLCDHMAPGMEIDVAIHAHNIPTEWPAEVEEQIKDLKETLSEADKKGRVDIRDIPLITIDGEDSRDFDDAVYCTPTDSGWKLLVAIADVSHYVDIGSALDIEAHNRATSVYFPGKVIPMLPEVLSNGLCSINPDVERLCMVCEMHIDKEGKVTGSKFFEGLMRSHARLTYNKVSDMLLDQNSPLREEYKHVIENVDDLNSLYKVLAKARKKRGSIDFDTQETRIMFDTNQRIENIVPTERNDAHKLIEECMIAANVTAAKFLLKHKVPTLYRDHDGPKATKLDDLRDFLSNFALTLGKSGTKASSKDYGILISSIKDRPDFNLIQTVLLRSLSQAVYSPDHIGHFGLSLENYAHFTSPIRRYPDLLVHRGIRHVLRGNKTPPYSHEAMVTLGEHCSANERRADEATRDAESALKCEYMLDKVGEAYHGIITAATSFGVFVELKEIYVEGLIHITNLPKDYYKFNPVAHRLTGENNGLTFRLGDPVNVRVAAVNMDERKIDFEFLHFDDEDQNVILEKIRSGSDAGAKKPRKKTKKAAAKKDKSSESVKDKPKKSVAKKAATETETPESEKQLKDDKDLSEEDLKAIAKKKKRKDKRKKLKAKIRKKKRDAEAEAKADKQD
ncbi:MAG: ribonuclease R [Gammaproteobacteria bacterium]|nr:ribonuclease R [Gammaproteobacteria bacterium]